MFYCESLRWPLDASKMHRDAPKSDYSADGLKTTEEAPRRFDHNMPTVCKKAGGPARGIAATRLPDSLRATLASDLSAHPCEDGGTSRDQLAAIADTLGHLDRVSAREVLLHEGLDEMAIALFLRLLLMLHESLANRNPHDH